MIEYSRHSPSSCNLFAASPAMWVLEKILGLKQPVGAIAHRGVAVEDGVTVGLLDPDAPLEACVDAALTKYDTLTAMSTDDRREKFRDDICDMVARALEELRPYGIPGATQGVIEWKPEGLKYPFIGFFDYHWQQHNITTDLKTTRADAIGGSRSAMPGKWRCMSPATPTPMQRVLTYCTPKKCADLFGRQHRCAHRDALYRIALKIEVSFLALSEDPKFFKSITVPDLESYFWSSPVARQLAWEHFGI